MSPTRDFSPLSATAFLASCSWRDSASTSIKTSSQILPTGRRPISHSQPVLAAALTVSTKTTALQNQISREKSERNRTFTLIQAASNRLLFDCHRWRHEISGLNGLKPTSDEARGADGRETDLCAIPFPLALHCVGSVLAVKGTLRALDGLRADPKDALLTRKKKRGGNGPKGNLSVIQDS